MSLIKSKISLLYNNFHFLVIGIVFTVLSYKNNIFIIALIIYLIICFFKNKKIFLSLLIVLIIFIVHFVLKEIVYHQIPNLNGIYQIINVSNNGNYYNYEIKQKAYKYKISTKDKYYIGDLIKIEGKLQENVVHYPKGFNYQEYLHFKNIKGIIEPTKITKVGNKFCIAKINYLIQDYIINNFEGIAKDYLMTLTIGVDDYLDTNSINKIGISHLFVISGLHVAMLIIILECLLKRMNIPIKVQKVIILMILGLYVIIVNFLISVIRVYLNYIFKLFFKLNQLDCISINFIIVVLINPYIILQLSFILSYMIAFFMCVYQEKKIVKNNRLNKILNLFILTLLIQLFVFPFVVAINPDFNLISILVNPFFIFLVSYLFLPFSFIILFIPILYPLYSNFVVIFDFLVQNIAKIDILTISLGNTNIYLKSLYYIFFYLLLKGYYLNNWKYFLGFIVILVCWYFKGIFVLTDQVYFLDLPEGEASLIISKNSSLVVLVDSGEVTNDLIMTKILKDFGIKKIDYLIITHGDSDHIGGAYDIAKSIKIKTLVLNKYDDLEKSYNIRKTAQKTMFLKESDKIIDKDLSINVLSPLNDYNNINDNSLAFILNFKNLKIFYTGDISEKVEYDIIQKHKNIDVDILKVAHHGSTTSSSIEFLNAIKYKYAIIMSGYYNKFGFPKDIVVNRIPKNKRLLTKELQTICFVCRQQRWILKN